MKLITNLQPSVSWCHLHLGTPLYLNMCSLWTHCDYHRSPITEHHFRLGSLFLLVKPHPVYQIKAKHIISEAMIIVWR